MNDRHQALLSEVRAAVLQTRALVAVTLLVLGLLAVRGYREPWETRGFLVWNLFLAWIPYVCARAIWRVAHDSSPLAVLLPLLIIWFAFLPNAPYLVTDVVHLHLYDTQNVMMLEVALFSAVALAGVLIGVASIQPIHRLIAERYGRRAATAFPPVIAIAVGLGVYLGRVQRWNSWAVVKTPGRLLHATWAVLGHPVSHPRAFGGIALFSVAFLVVYCALTMGQDSLGAPRRQPEL